MMLGKNVFVGKMLLLRVALVQWRSWGHLTSRALRPAQARGVRGMHPRENFDFRSLEWPFPAISG